MFCAVFLDGSVLRTSFGGSILRTKKSSGVSLAISARISTISWVNKGGIPSEHKKELDGI